MEGESEILPKPEFEVRKTVFPEEKVDQEPESPPEATNGTNGGHHEEANHVEAAAEAEPEPVANDHAPEEPMDVDGKVGAEVQSDVEPVQGQPAELEPEVENKPDDTKQEAEEQPVEPQPDEQPTKILAEAQDQRGETQADESATDSTIKPEASGTEAAVEAGKTEAEVKSAAEPASAFDALVSGETKEDKVSEASEEKHSEFSTNASVAAAAEPEKPVEEAEKKDNEVFDVEDDGNIIPAKPKMPADAEYFESLDSEELEWYKEHVQDHNRKLQCTSCFKQVNSEINAHSGVFRHPLLGVVMCKACKNYYDDGEWSKDEDGFDMFCRWCGQGGDIMLCDKCTHAFCKKCLQRNLGRKLMSEISASEEWKCLVCDPKQIFELRALYYALYVNQKDILEKKLKKQEEQVKRRSSMAATPKKSLKPAEEAVPEPPEMTFSSENFLDDNFSEAMKTLSEFQQLMDEEQGRWNEANKVLDPEIATSITRKLRKFYNATKQSMESLDRALATAYVSKYPEEAKRIHLGKDDEVIDAETEYGSVKKRQPKQKKKPLLKTVVATPKRTAAVKKKKILPKKKVLEEKKRKAAEAKTAAKAPPKTVGRKPVPKSKAVSKPGPKSKKAESNASKSYVTPSLTAAMAKKKPTKVSANLFKAKKRPAPASRDSDDESDIEILEEVEQSPPPAKKPKIGPKSKTRV